MKQSEFLTIVCKAIANNEIKGNARMLLAELAVKGACRPVAAVSRGYSDSTDKVLEALQQCGMPECLPSKKGNYFATGWYVQNDAPRGGKLGTIIKINFER
jgi:hypothetical protein